MMLSKIYLISFFIFFSLALFFMFKSFFSHGKNALIKDSKNKKYNMVIIFGLLFAVITLSLNVIFALIILSVLLYVYWIYKQYRKDSYKNLINKQLLETVRLFKNAVISGQSQAQAFDSVSKQISKPLSSEFQKIFSDISFGISIEKAIENSIERIENEQYRLFLDSVKISGSTGASLSEILGKIEAAISQKLAVYSKLNTLTAQAKISGMVISIVPVVIVLFVLACEPEMMSVLFTDILGNIVLFISVIMILSGSFFMKKISEVDI